MRTICAFRSILHCIIAGFWKAIITGASRGDTRAEWGSIRECLIALILPERAAEFTSVTLAQPLFAAANIRGLLYIDVHNLLM